MPSTPQIKASTGLYEGRSGFQELKDRLGTLPFTLSAPYSLFYNVYAPLEITKGM